MIWRSWYSASCLCRKRFSAASTGAGRRQRRRKRTTSTKNVSSVPVRCNTLWSRLVYRAMAKVSLCNKIVIPDYYPWCEGDRPERGGWSHCGAQGVLVRFGVLVNLRGGQRSITGRSHGGPEGYMRTASWTGPPMAQARGRAYGHGAVGGRHHDPRLASRYWGVDPSAPIGVCGP